MTTASSVHASPAVAPRRRGLPPWLGTLVLGVAMTVGLAVLLAAFAGVFKDKVPMEVPERRQTWSGDEPTAEVRLIKRPRFESAVGTVRAVHESSIASKILARVVEVNVKAGQPVTKGDVVARLDDSDLQARLKQARAAEAVAVAAHAKAVQDHERIRRAAATGAVSSQELDQVVAALRSAEAELERARQAISEAEVMLGYATLTAPLTGVVIDKRVEVGDTVAPGQILMTVYDPTRLQMVASVRESLALRLKVGDTVPAKLESLNYECTATVSEIVPEAQAASRSFTVKVTGPCPPGVYSGMFGRIFIPLDEEEIIVVPKSAVVRVGQLDMVNVVVEGRVERRSVQLGRRLNGEVEVLSGLVPGERVTLPKKGA